MHRVALVYKSLTGNTKAIGEAVEKYLVDCQIDHYVMEETEPTVFLQYDGILIGTYTWGNGGLPFDAQVLYKKMKNVNLQGKIVGCFGSGDRIYPNFCAGVDIMEERAKECGATTIVEGLRIHLSPSGPKDIDSCTSFANRFLRSLNEKGAFI